VQSDTVPEPTPSPPFYSRLSKRLERERHRPAAGLHVCGHSSLRIEVTLRTAGLPIWDEEAIQHQTQMAFIVPVFEGLQAAAP
jgi:hypothetical protein